jgi:uncharacterized Zn-finger protein
MNYVVLRNTVWCCILFFKSLKNLTLLRKRNSLKNSSNTTTWWSDMQCNHIYSLQNFALKAAQQVHERTHKTERPYKCPVPGCGAFFKQKMHMLRHQRTHTGSRPFECSICGRLFSQKSSCICHDFGVHNIVGKVKDIPFIDKRN